MLIVSNTSPLSNLAFIDEIKFVQKIYPRVLIPPIVHIELMRLPKNQPTIMNLVDTGWLEIKFPQNVPLVKTLNQSLDPGEAEAIALAIELNADRLLIDERLGRNIAKQYGLKIRGILGILVHLKEQGLIPATKPILDRLRREAGFRVGQELYSRILQESGE
jgi:uncharacterized protein